MHVWLQGSAAGEHAVVRPLARVRANCTYTCCYERVGAVVYLHVEVKGDNSGQIWLCACLDVSSGPTVHVYEAVRTGG